MAQEKRGRSEVASWRALCARKYGAHGTGVGPRGSLAAATVNSERPLRTLLLLKVKTLGTQQGVGVDGKCIDSGHLWGSWVPLQGQLRRGLGGGGNPG